MSNMEKKHLESLHELQLKFIVKNKIDGYIVAVFSTGHDALKYRKELGDNYEVKQSY